MMKNLYIFARDYNYQEQTEDLNVLYQILNTMADLNTRISDFVWANLKEKHINGKTDPFWESPGKPELNSG
jgi:hypothetical protein